jgi:hypothetical protein
MTPPLAVADLHDAVEVHDEDDVVAAVTDIGEHERYEDDSREDARRPLLRRLPVGLLASTAGALVGLALATVLYLALTGSTAA